MAIITTDPDTKKRSYGTSYDSFFLMKFTRALDIFTYSMEQSPSGQADWFSASQKSFCIVWNTKVLYCIYKCLSPVPILSQINLFHAPHPSSWRFILILFCISTCGSCKWSFSLQVSPPNPVYTSPLPISAICPVHLILLNLITQKIFGEAYRSLCFSLCRFLHSPVTLSLLGPNILLSTLFSNILSLRSKFQTCTKNRQNYSFVYLNLYILG